MLLGRAWTILAGPATLFVIASSLSREEQGYYYTFFSLAGLTLFFELGLSFVVVQFASHEKAKLEWSASGTLEGDSEAKSRLSSLVRAATCWYGVAAALVLLLIGPAGFCFFEREHPGSGVAWQGPWAAVVGCTALTLGLSPWYAALEGLGLVHETAKWRFRQGVLGNVLTWSALISGLGLFAASGVGLAGVLCGVTWLVGTRRRALGDLWGSKAGKAEIRWWAEVWPMQWRMALTWVSGYFLMQFFTPVLFAYRGEKEAGQWGMSFTLVGAVTSVASFWIYAKAPYFGTLVSRRAFAELDHLFFRSFTQSLVVGVGGVICLLVGVAIVQHVGERWGERLLSPLPLALLACGALASHVVMAQAVYLRAHKREPFVVIALVLGGLVGLCTFVFGRRYGSVAMAAGYCVSYVAVGVCGGTWLFLAKRREWHSDSIGDPVRQDRGRSPEEHQTR
jgi:hypothetical protein